MHNHLSGGWQNMSDEDLVAERDRISPPARATGHPLVGLTLGTDGSWSARFWAWDGERFNRSWCDKVRVAGRRLRFTFNDDTMPPPRRRPTLHRTIDTWGNARQSDIARLRIGVVGVGSVGCMVAEALARIGVEKLVLIDPDKVEMHNLDRLLYAGKENVGNTRWSWRRNICETARPPQISRCGATPSRSSTKIPSPPPWTATFCSPP